MTIIVFDTETTGLLSPIAAGVEHQPYLVEFSAYKLDKNLKQFDYLEFRCKPPIKIPDEAIKIHRITNEMVKDAPPFEAHYPALANFFLGTNICVGHNITFDKMIIWWELYRMGKTMNFPWGLRDIDTVEVCVQHYGHRKNLADLYGELFDGATIAEAHSSKADCRATMNCFIRMMERNMVL